MKKASLEKEIGNLSIFTARHNQLMYKLFEKKPESIGIKDGKYYFIYNNKEYEFSMLSDEDINEKDKKILQGIKRMKLYFYRVLRLAGSLDLVDPYILIGESSFGTFDVLISYKKNNTDYIINYARNLIMKKEDYDEVFNFKENIKVSKYDLYRISIILDENLEFNKIIEYFKNPQANLDNYKDSEEFSGSCVLSDEKFDYIGFNAKNYLLFGSGCDSIFFQIEDYTNVGINGKLRHFYGNMINDFTINPKFSLRVIKSRKSKTYNILSFGFGLIKFSLLSDLLESKKDMLLSKDRYEKCHDNSLEIASMLKEDIDDVFIVGGKTGINDREYFYHSWIEIDSKNLVLDANRNIIMNRDLYYKLYKAVPINKTSVEDMYYIIELACQKFELPIDPMTLNYFGDLIYNDLLKNEKILQIKK